MRIKPIASNMTELNSDTACVLFSYSTPVAGSADGIGLFKTDKWYSQTTTRHINKYFRNEWDVDPDTVQTIPQEKIDALFNKKQNDNVDEYITPEALQLCDLT